jgi:hypothetical protein
MKSIKYNIKKKNITKNININAIILIQFLWGLICIEVFFMINFLSNLNWEY